MDAIPELARLAEAHGFDCAWGGEANNKDPTAGEMKNFIAYWTPATTGLDN
jgi:alkanesulfonate monooxygenase SsuD/methylene tetrahydromethanopterin reductase-like flavin-dependent oxidoreductase (luciferase family)